MEVQSQEQIDERKKEIEQELVEMLQATGSDFSLQHVKDIVFNEEESDDMMKIVAIFDNGGGASEIENALDIATDAWNYFPHKALNGLSPAEVVLKSQKK